MNYPPKGFLGRQAPISMMYRKRRPKEAVSTTKKPYPGTFNDKAHPQNPPQRLIQLPVSPKTPREKDPGKGGRDATCSHGDTQLDSVGLSAGSSSGPALYHLEAERPLFPLILSHPQNRSPLVKLTFVYFIYMH